MLALIDRAGQASVAQDLLYKGEGNRLCFASTQAERDLDEFSRGAAPRDTTTPSEGFYKALQQNLGGSMDEPHLGQPVFHPGFQTLGTLCSSR